MGQSARGLAYNLPTTYPLEHDATTLERARSDFKRRRRRIGITCDCPALKAQTGGIYHRWLKEPDMSDRTSAQIPEYRLHKPTGRGVVRLNGRDIYLGTHGTPESQER